MSKELINQVEKKHKIFAEYLNKNKHFLTLFNKMTEEQRQAFRKIVITKLTLKTIK